MTEGAWHDLDVAPDLAEGEIAAARVDGIDLAVVRWSGGWLAFEDTCTHAHCPFTEFGEIDDGVLICNCHGAEFDLATGRVLLDPAEEPIEILAVREQGGRLQVGLAGAAVDRP